MGERRWREQRQGQKDALDVKGERNGSGTDRCKERRMNGKGKDGVRCEERATKDVGVWDFDVAKSLCEEI